jgi:hypothetical protein
MGERRKEGIYNKSSIGKSKGKGHLKVLSLCGRVALKWIARKCEWAG